MRPIDADALKDHLQSLAYDDWNQGVCTSWADAYRECADMVDEQPTIEPEPKPIEYQDCANVLLKLWMDNVLTDGEYYKIICKLNAHLIEMAYEEGAEQE